MSQRASGYTRVERDVYETPTWVTHALLPHLPKACRIWEPAAGSGKMVAALRSAGHKVTATDITTGHDFLSCGIGGWGAIVTNPPYDQAEQFIEIALSLTGPDGMVAMLLRTDYDHAQTRQGLFGKCGQFSKKVVLTKRIRWFEDSKGSPSYNHAWFIWDWRHKGPPTLAYA
jgi:hypothetical protein